MSRRKLKARDKVTQKMSRDGAVLRNETTGEHRNISGREADSDLRGRASEQDKPGNPANADRNDT
jgi:hypothetical protein